MNKGVWIPSGARPVPGAFDAVAADYDARFTGRLLGRWLRAAVWRRLEAEFRPGDRVLELGCGTGEDAIRMAGLGISVTATDSSAGMLAAASRKAEAVGAHRIDFARFDLAAGVSDDAFTAEDRQDVAALRRGGPYDGVFSNFGALNCLPDRAPLAGTLAELMRPGAPLLVVLMGPVCPWEIAWHLAHGQPRRAMRRFRRGCRAHVGGGVMLPVWYPSPRRLRRELADRFRHRRTIGIGVLLPPSYLAPLVQRHERAFTLLRWLDQRLGARFPWNHAGDHYLAIFDRR